MATKNEQLEFVKKVYPAAWNIFNEKDSICPVFVTAQAALETGWKIKGISNNIFGITKGSWSGKTELVPTTEIFDGPDRKFKLPERVSSVEQQGDGRYKYRVYRLFRAYDSIEECLEDHLGVLKGSGYADAWPHRKDAMEFARRISDRVGSRYATDPNYAATMGKMICTVERIIKENEIVL